MIQIEELPGTRVGLIADAHIHPGQTPPFPDALRQAFAGAGAILALGDMGESSGLDWLQSIAPVWAVRGADDPVSDPRLKGELRLFRIGELTVAALFDGVKHGLFTSSDPLSLAPDFARRVTELFGMNPDVLVCASTHKSCIAAAHGVLIVNPGSPTLADSKTAAILDCETGVARVEIIGL